MFNNQPAKELFPTKQNPKPIFGVSTKPQTSSPFGNPSTNTTTSTNPNPKLDVFRQPANSTEEKLRRQIKSELQIRDKKIETLEMQVRTLTNSVNMCMMIISELKESKPKNFVLSPFNKPDEQKTEDRGNPLAHIAPISLVGSEVVHKSENYSLHRPVSEDLSKVIDLKVENNCGKVIFRQPINLLKTKKKLHECIHIDNSNVRVIQDEWKNKKCDIVLYNFRGFLDAGFDDKQLIIEGISKMKEEKNIKMEIVEFDMDLGNLYLKSSGI